METHGLEIKKKAKPFARESVFTLAGSSDLQHEEVTANNCGLPLLQYSLEDDRMILYKVLQKQYSLMITAPKIKYASPDISPWIPEELHDFWLKQKKTATHPLESKPRTIPGRTSWSIWCPPATASTWEIKCVHILRRRSRIIKILHTGDKASLDRCG